MKFKELENLYQDFSGTPVTQVGQPVGLVIDKSQGQALGPELITNGRFSASSNGWTGDATYEISSGVLILSSGELTQSAVTEADKVYLFDANVTSTNEEGTVEFKLGTTPGGSEICNIDISGSTRLHRHFVAPGATTYVTLNNPDSMPSAPISSLFASGEEGAWYDPSDFDTLFEDSYGTIPVTGVGQPVGLMLDKSKNLTLGSEQVVDGTFTDIANWLADGTPTIREIDVNGDLHISGAHNTGVTQQIPGLTTGWYEVTIEARLVTGGIKFQMNYAETIGPSQPGSTFSTSTWKVYLNQGRRDLKIACAGNSEFYVRSISIKPLAGNHASQSTSTARPVLQESNGLYYLDFDGVDDLLETSFASPIAQPNTTYLGYKLYALSNPGQNKFIYDSQDLTNRQTTYNQFSSIFIYGGQGFGQTYVGTTDTTVQGVLFNNTSSWSRINGSQTTRSLGTNSFGGITLACYFGAQTIYCNALRLYGWINVDRSLTSDEIDLVESYLATKSGVAGFPEYTTEDPIPYSFDNISLKDVAGFHAKQPTSTARPVLAQTGSYYYLDFDKVDDRLLIDVPGQVSGTAVISDVRGTAAYGVAIPSGTFAIGTNSLSVNYSFNDDLFGMLVRNVAMSGTEIDLAFQYFRDNGATLVGPDAYGDTTSFLRFWREATWITEFPLIDTSQANIFEAAWYGCTNLKSFPLIDTSQATNLSYAWFNCNSLSSFPAINTSQVTNFQDTWRGCSNLSSFPLIDVTNASILYRTWYQCTSLSSFPQIDTTDVISLNQTWFQCTNLKSFPLIDTSKVVSFYLTWNRCGSLSSFPAINTSSAGGLNYAWEWCQNLSSFPQIDTSKVTGFAKTWKSCRSLSSFPQIDCRAATDLFQTWYDCINLEYFPSGVFDNTSGTVNFTSTFQDTKLNTQSIDNVLLSVNTANTSNGAINLNSTNMQSPGVGGTYAKHRLESRGWTVNTKPISDDVIVSSIFYTGQYGTWYDVNDLDTLFETTTGGAEVTGAGQPVGLMLDKSLGLVPGEEELTNGTFDTDLSGWSFDTYNNGQDANNYWEWVDGKARVVSDGTFINMYQSCFIIGKTYEITVDVTSVSGTIKIGTNSTAAGIAGLQNIGTGSYRVVFVADGATLFIGRQSGITDVSIDNISVKELPGNHAYQNTSTARPILQGSAGDYHLDYDQVDDRLLVDVSGFNGTAYIPTEEGSVAYGVAIPSGTYALGTNTTGVTYSFAKELVGGIITDTPMLAPEIGALDQFFAARGAGPYGASAYGGVTNLYQYWRNADWITEFPLIDSSQVTIFRDAWSYCYNLRSFPELNSSAVTSLWSSWAKCYSLSSFPLIDTSQVTDFMEAWGQCYSLSSFPLIDTSKGTRFQQAWWTCSSLTSFPAINTSAGTNFTQTWNGCTNLTDFPLIDTSQALAIDRTWNNCYSLTSFPAINTSAATHFNQAWSNCNSLSSFPLIDTSQATSLYSTWYSCTSLADFPLIDTSQVTSLISTWFACRNLSSFPLIDTSQVTDMYYTWNGCKILANFPEINTSAVTRFQRTWFDCDGLSSFPAIDCRSATNLDATWYGAGNLESFPAGVFDNTSGTVDFSNTFYGTKLNSQSVDNVIVSVNNANTSAGILTLNSAAQGMQAPTASGLLAADYLYDRGWTLNLVGGYTPLNTRVSGIASSDYGLWVDAFDTDYIYEDSSGTIQVTGLEAPVGLLVDRSGNGLNVIQSTSTARPILTARYNELDYSQDFDVTSVWNTYETYTSSVSGVLAPDGTETVTFLGELGNVNTPNHYIRQRVIGGSKVSGEYIYTASVYLKPAGRNYARVGLLCSNYGVYAQCIIDLSANTASIYSENMTPYSAPSALIEDVGDGWKRCSVTAALYRFHGMGYNDPSILINPLATNNPSQYYVGDPTSGLYIWGAQIETGLSTHNYQRTYDSSSYEDNGFYKYLSNDNVDDLIITTTSGIIGEAVIATKKGILKYGVNIPSGTFSLMETSPNFTNELHGLVIKEGQFTEDELITIYGYFEKNTEAPSKDSSFEVLGGFINTWNGVSWITNLDKFDSRNARVFYRTFYNANTLSSIPLIDTSNGRTFTQTWYGCTSLQEMPLIDTSNAESMKGAWYNCRSLSSFPAINTSSLTGPYSFEQNTGGAWENCVSLTSFPYIEIGHLSYLGRWVWRSCTNLRSFPLLDTSRIGNFEGLWQNCVSLSSFPEINTSSAVSLGNTWTGCNSLSSFPLIDTSKVTSLLNTWTNCTSLQDFPAINTSKVISFSQSWYGCASLTSFPEITTSSATTLYRTWRDCDSLPNFPLIDTATITSFSQTWQSCNSLTSFPALNTSAGTNFSYAWTYCNSLSSFPLIDTSQATNFAFTWQGCASLQSFPALNTSAVTSFDETWRQCQSLSSFPQIDCRSATDLTLTWYNCLALEHFPAGVFDNTSGTTDFSTTFSNTKLNTQSVDNVLVSINNADTSSGTLTLNSTNMQPPSYWGIVASGLLEDRGWTVNTKTPTAEAQLDSTIASLFFSGDEGAWYDPSDFTTMYQDSIGLTPVTGTGQPVGLILDKSKGLQLGNELVDQANTNVSAWVAGSNLVELDGNEIKITGVVGLPGPYINLNAAENALTTSLTAGKWYKMSFDVRTNGEVVRLVRATSQTANLDVNRSNTTVETITHYFRSDGSELFRVDTDAGDIAWISNISLRELPGNHAYQQTSTARPVLQVDASSNYYLDFDGVDDALLGPVFNPALPQPNTLFVATKVDTTALQFIYDGYLSTDRHTLNVRPGGAYFGAFAGSANDVFAVDLNRHVFTVNYDSSNSFVNVDGSSVFTGDLGSFSWGGIVLGRLFPAAGDPASLNGRIYNFVGIERNLTSTEIDTVESYLATKSGVTL